MPDYFAFYRIPRQFFPDQRALRQAYLRISREAHPDFFTQSFSHQRLKAEELSSLNNQAFATLSDWDARLAHLLMLEGVMPAEGEAQMSSDFLMDMMEINEQIMELHMDTDVDRVAVLREEILNREAGMLDEVKHVCNQYDKGEETDLSAVSDYYLKRKYLRRILASLDALES